MKKYTVEDIMALKPCYAYRESRVRELWGGRDALSPREIASLNIPYEHIAWCLAGLVDKYDAQKTVASFMIDHARCFNDDRALGTFRVYICCVDATNSSNLYIEWMVEYLEGVE